MKTCSPRPSHLTALERIDPRWTWHHDVLLQLRQKLLHVQETRERSALGVASDPGHHADNLTDEESAPEIVLFELLPESRRLPEIEAALQRLRTGTYGICEKTGEPISAERLHAIPWTRFARPATAGPQAAR